MKNKIFSDDVLHNLFDCFLLIMTKQDSICTKNTVSLFSTENVFLVYYSETEKRRFKSKHLFPNHFVIARLA